MRFSVGVGIPGCVADGISAGHGGLSGLAGRFAKRLETRGKISGSILIGGELLLKRADGLNSISLGGCARARESQRQREPDDGPYAGDNNQEGNRDFQRARPPAGLFRKNRFRFGLLRAAIRAHGARGINRLLAILAEVHAGGRGYGVCA